jgi:hypothetical protein
MENTTLEREDRKPITIRDLKQILKENNVPDCAVIRVMGDAEGNSEHSVLSIELHHDGRITFWPSD